MEEDRMKASTRFWLLAAARCAGVIAAGLVIGTALSVILSGCASSTIEIFVPGTEIREAKVTQSFLGRGCVAVDRSVAGKISVIVQQDGSSDWSASRLLGWLGDIAGNVFGGESRSKRMEAPDAAQGCAGVFE